MNTGLLLLIIGASIDTVGDIIMKEWVINKNPWLFALGMFIYLVGLGFLAFSYNYKNIAVASVIFVILNVVALSLVSWFYFKEVLTPIQIVGIVVGIVAIFILEIN